jgi:hypothetical protein
MSDIARQYPAGQELAKGGSNLAVQYPAGQEKASHANKDSAHDYRDDRTK